MRRLPVFHNSAILSWAGDEGPEALSSAALEEALAPLFHSASLPSGIIEKMTGIKSRNLYPLDAPPSLMAAAAARRLFTRSGFPPEETDVLYSTSVGRDCLEPSTASIVHSRLGLGPMCSSLDLGSACLGFVDGLVLSSLQTDAGAIDYALVVAGENSRPVLESTVRRLLAPGVKTGEFFRHFATLTLGSGGAAMLVGRADRHPEAPRIKGVSTLSDPHSVDLCRGDDESMVTDSGKLLLKGVELARETFRRGEEAFGWNPDYFHLVISHQVSEVNTRRFAEALGLPWGKVFKTYPRYGNMGPAAIPFAFHLADREGLVRPGMRIALMGIGSGLACAMLELEIPKGYRGALSFPPA
ncbi:MAG: 3-oxoacyl-ACP synthase III [Deltaproteobacteria bacterium]|jgi:3-oxoacyl-[acyl-carrier-protein] synthase-3|nr:3-oxoacyl-ACP synthase III [Deltaproteobacteria bacterium]